MAATIEELLQALQNPNKPLSENKILENTKETWDRIGRKDSFSELGLEPSELDSFLQDWMTENPYNNI